MRFLLWQAAWPSPIWQPNSFTNPPQFAYPCIIAAPYQGTLNPRIAFITGRNALIFQNRFVTTTFFRNFAAVFCVKIQTPPPAPPLEGRGVPSGD